MAAMRRLGVGEARKGIYAKKIKQKQQNKHKNLKQKSKLKMAPACVPRAIFIILTGVIHRCGKPVDNEYKFYTKTLAMLCTMEDTKDTKINTRG